MTRRLMLLLLAAVTVTVLAGCVAGAPSDIVNPPVVNPWPEATTEYLDSGAEVGVVPNSPTGAAFDKVYTKSDGQNLYVKVTFSKVGVGQNFYLLIDDTAQQSGYDPSRWNATLTTWWGNMGLKFIKNGVAFFDPDFVYLRGRSWDTSTGGVWLNDDWAKIANAIIGPDESSSVSVKQLIGETALAADGSAYEITIPYAAIGHGATSGAKLQLVALLGRDVWAKEGEFLDPTQRPLGIQTMIPYSGQAITDAGTPEARISDVNDAIRVTLK